jgi:hypothetical protein
MRVFALLFTAASCLALAYPAAAQTSDHFADFSALDAAVFARSLQAPSADPQFGGSSPFVPNGHVIATFTPFTQSYASKTFMQNLRDIRRYGGRLSVPFSAFGKTFLLEGEGARDYGPTSKKLDIARLRLTKDLGHGYGAGFELGLFRGNPSDLRGAPHIDQEWVYGLNLTKRFGIH